MDVEQHAGGDRRRNGLVTAVGAGTTTITASSTNGPFTASTTLTVTAATLNTITLTPPAVSVALGLSQQLKATGIYSDGTSVDLSGSVTWTPSAVGDVTITPGGLCYGHCRRNHPDDLGHVADRDLERADHGDGDAENSSIYHGHLCGVCYIGFHWSPVTVDCDGDLFGSDHLQRQHFGIVGILGPQYRERVEYRLSDRCGRRRLADIVCQQPGRVGQQPPRQRDGPATAQQQPVQYISAAGEYQRTTPDPGELRTCLSLLGPAIRGHGNRQRLELRHFRRPGNRLDVAPSAAPSATLATPGRLRGGADGAVAGPRHATRTSNSR